MNIIMSYYNLYIQDLSGLSYDLRSSRRNTVVAPIMINVISEGKIAVAW